MINETPTPISYKTIEEIQLRKAMVQKDIQKADNKIRTLWTSLFTKPDALRKNATPSKRINSLMNTGAGVFDAFMLGWKLYRKFKR